MGVFNLVDDGTTPGCAALKLSDGRKRSMSLWVEFITASGYLSSRKIRARFQSLMASALEKSRFAPILSLCHKTTDVVLSVSGSYCIRIIPAFRCGGMWPRSAQNWPRADSNQIWPQPQASVKIFRDVIRTFYEFKMF